MFASEMDCGVKSANTFLPFPVVKWRPIAKPLVLVCHGP